MSRNLEIPDGGFVLIAHKCEAPQREGSYLGYAVELEVDQENISPEVVIKLLHEFANALEARVRNAIAENN